jgi:hypothetical protein
MQHTTSPSVVGGFLPSNRFSVWGGPLLAVALVFAPAAARGGDKSLVPLAEKNPAAPPALTLNLSPQMIGDLGFQVREFIPASPFKIAENESPRPTNRVFITYNYYDDIRLGERIPGFQTDLHRETIGFEKTFLDGSTSVGLRLPFLQTQFTDPIASRSDSDLGDLSLITKFAFINDHNTGNVFSGGLVVTLPTASGETEFNDAKLQPFVGGVFNVGNFYLHGFSSVAIPTDSDDTPLLFNDMGVGHFLYTNPNTFLSQIVPTLEVHINTPLNHRDEPVPDIVNLTPGVHLQFSGRAWLTVGAGIPLTGPRPFDIEGIAQFNFRF